MRLAEYLDENSSTPTKFAAAIGVSASTITRLLRGERRPGLALLDKIARATKGQVTVADFLPAQSTPATASLPSPFPTEADA